MIKKFLYYVKKDLLSLCGYPKKEMGAEIDVDYSRYWGKRKRGNEAILSAWQKTRADIVLSLIEENSQALDIGCGDGAVLQYLKQKKGINGVGVDVSDMILEVAEKIGIKVIKMDVNDKKEVESLPEVDYVFGFEIIEHMPKPELFIHQIKAKAKKGIILSFPNSGYYIYRLRLLLGRFPVQWIDNPGEHLRYWTYKDAIWWVNFIGLNLENIIPYEGLPVLNKIMPGLFAKGLIIKIK